MARKIKLTEEEVAKVATSVFKYKGFTDVYPEVTMKTFGGIPDLIATKNIGDSNHKWVNVIECKASLTYPVLEQVCRWHIDADITRKSSWANQDRIAIPHFLWVVSGNSASSKVSDLKQYLLDKFRIGWIDVTVYEDLNEWQLDNDYYKERFKEGVVVDQGSDYGYIRFGNRVYSFRQMVEAKLQHGSRQTAHKISDQLFPEMKQAVAGVKADKANRMTPFKLTILRTYSSMEKGRYYRPQQLLELVKSHGGHHYTSDRTYLASIGKFLLKFGHCETDGAWHPRYKLKEK